MTTPHNFMDNYGRPDFKLPYRWNNDNPLTLPLGPKNINATSPYLIGVIDIRWDSPTEYAEHSGYNILGVNVYRSYDTPEGTYTKMNDVPIGALYYRDETREVWADQEDPVAGGRLLAGTNAPADWVVHTFNKPIVMPGTNGEIANHPTHVRVEIRPTSLDSFQTVPAFKVFGESGEIFLINRQTYNNQYNRLDPPVLPNLSSGGEIRVSYTYINNHIQLDANRKVYYKCTTVGIDASNDEMKETPLNEVEAISLYDMEKIDWIWAESIRRNRWMLEQAGERVKLFIRKWAGEKCPCWDEQYRTAKNDCHLCAGTGYIGGYEGGYDIIIAPPETEKTVQLMDMGLHVSYDWQTWMGPYPLLNDRDFIVRQNGDRLSIAHVNPQGSRGAIYQQHFMLSPLDRRDPRYTVAINGGINVPAAWNAFRQSRPSDASPTIPNKPEIPDQYELRGRTVTFENIVYAIPPFVILGMSAIIKGVASCTNVLS